MAISKIPNSRHLKFADMFFFLDEGGILNVYILRNVPLIGTSEKEMLDKGIKLLESGFGTCEWLINLNQQLPIYINKRYYRKISERYSAFSEMLQMERNIAGTYVFDLLITDMPDGYSKAEIITGLTITADNYHEAMSKAHEWVEMNYSDFKELEWYIRDRGKMLIFNISVADFIYERA